MDRPQDQSQEPEQQPEQRQEQRQEQQEKDFQTRRQNAVYQGASEAVIAIPVAALFGYWVDGYFDTGPVFLLIGFAVGFASFTVRLIRLGRWVEGEDSGRDASANGQDAATGSRQKKGRKLCFGGSPWRPATPRPLRNSRTSCSCADASVVRKHLPSPL